MRVVRWNKSGSLECLGKIVQHSFVARLPLLNIRVAGADVLRHPDTLPSARDIEKACAPLLGRSLMIPHNYRPI
ncbi:hypothetical protein AB0I85_21150 [Micromonospora echinofusca]|uniref:hypothetical protein n=1 Tax=Micromonospora echinofusca TaxID=47858 RepID=UPI0033E3391F